LKDIVRQGEVIFDFIIQVPYEYKTFYMIFLLNNGGKLLEPDIIGREVTAGLLEYCQFVFHCGDMVQVSKYGFQNIDKC
jgi:hypothetical protein